MPTDKILAGIGRFQEEFQANRALFERLAIKQEPKMLFITCSDSRVAPELITGAEAGDLFVARTIANIVPPYGTGAIGAGAVIEYAILHLHMEHIVICGHTDCGGIKGLDAALDLSREPHIARWLDLARPAKTKVEAGGFPQEARHLATVRENVLLQLENLRSYDPVRDALRAGSLALHGWVYHLESGAIEAYDAESGTWKPLP
ncbi:MAG: carbonic anhydrase [Anaerolineae bacterium]|jgi:carbonic anhydrase